MPTPIVVRVFRGDDLLRTEQFSREIIKIGRLASAHLVLDEEGIARIHAVIEVAPGGALSIIDMGSAGGTVVNGKKVSRSTVEPGDVVSIGPLSLVVDVGDEAAVAAEPAAQAPVAPAPPAPAAPAPAQAPAPRATAMGIPAAKPAASARATVAAIPAVAAPAPAPA